MTGKAKGSISYSMKKLSEPTKKPRPVHTVAHQLEELILQRLNDRRDELGLSDLGLGEKTYRVLGYDDPQKKINNTLRGKTGIKLSDFYILCEGLGLPPDRVLSSALDNMFTKPKEADLPEQEGGGEKAVSSTEYDLSSPSSSAHE